MHVLNFCWCESNTYTQWDISRFVYLTILHECVCVLCGFDSRYECITLLNWMKIYIFLFQFQFPWKTISLRIIISLGLSAHLFRSIFFFIRPLAIIHFVMAFQIVIHKRIYNEKKDQQKKTHKKNVVNSLWHFTQYHSIKFIEKIIKFFVFFIFQCLLLPHWPKWNKIRGKKIISFLLPSQFIEKCSKFIHEWIYSSYFMHIKRNHRSSFLFR